MKTNDSVTKNLAQCLTLDFKPGRKELLKHVFGSEDYDLDSWVKAASYQFVLPAVFLQMERARLLSVLPKELVDHLAEITQRNRERNRRIMEEVREISANLAKKRIEPVFLKGAAHLLLDLYIDPAERMIGDIDFLVKDEDIFPAVEVLTDMGFKPLVEYNVNIHKDMKHYPRMVNYDYAAAVEVHREVVLEPYRKYFPASQMLSWKQRIPGMQGIFVPSNRHLIVHNMMNAQFNDRAYKNRMILLRQMYDMLLLSQREDPQNALAKYKTCNNEANAWLALNATLFELPEEIKYTDSKQVQNYIRRFIRLQNHPGSLFLFHTFYYFSWRLGRYISLPLKAVIDKSTRTGIWERLSDPTWYKKHFESYLNYFNPHRHFKK